MNNVQERIKYNNSMKKLYVLTFIMMIVLGVAKDAAAQTSAVKIPKGGKKISDHLFGLFFEDINYAADGGLYAELIQNRSFEYNPAERREWHSLSYWEYVTTGFSYGSISVATSNPLHVNNPHYVVLDVEHIHNAEGAVGIRNSGFNGIVVRKGENYEFSLFASLLGNTPVQLKINLQNKNGDTVAAVAVEVNSPGWKKYEAVLQASADVDSAVLSVMAVSKGKLAIDMVSLFPQKTFKNRKNGLRPDLAQLLADMHPGFIRFPGGCLTHGDGLGNMYRWKNTIGPVEQRVEQRNIWGYHQTAGLGYYEYFQFCEDIGAKPLPVLPAAVSCQNSGGTWRIGGTGQQALPKDQMGDYIQEVLDLLEWANGPATSVWGAKRAAAGHPAPFNLQYVGIGNEDKITPEFTERFSAIYKSVRSKHPEITVVGTAGPFPDGEDFTKGWQLANQLNVPVMDEHYYKEPEWFISNQYRYDGYNRDSSTVYLGEYASWGNKMKNALAEAIYMTALERNGDVVTMASYAPLFAKRHFTQWTTDMIFFNNNSYYLTPNYYVQQMFTANQGDYYFGNVVSKDSKDSLLGSSCVYNSKDGDVIIKLVNAGMTDKKVGINLTSFASILPEAVAIKLQADTSAANSFERPSTIKPVTTTISVAKRLDYTVTPSSVIVIRLRTRK